MGLQRNLSASPILGDPGADSGGKGKTKRAEKNGAKKRLEDSARLVFPLPPLSAPGSPRMCIPRNNAFPYKTIPMIFFSQLFAK